MRGTTGSAAAPATCRNCLRWGSFILNLPSHHSITSSATSSVGGTARPSVLAVLRLYDKLVFCWRLHRQVFAFEEASTVHACHLGEALATSRGHTVTSSLLRHWTMTGTASVLSPV